MVKIQGVFCSSLVPPLKNRSTKKLFYARLGVSRPIYVNVDSPSLGFTYFNFLGGNQWKENTLYLNSVVNHLSCFSKVTTNVQRRWEAMSNCLRIVSIQFLGSPARCLHCQIAYVPVPAAAEREMSNSFAGNLDNVPGNKSVHIRRSWMRTFEQFKQIGIHWHWPVVKRWKSLTNGSRFNRTVLHLWTCTFHWLLSAHSTNLTAMFQTEGSKSHI